MPRCHGISAGGFQGGTVTTPPSVIYIRSLALWEPPNPVPPMSPPTVEVTPVSEVTLPEIQKIDSASVPVTHVTAPRYDEPVATRRELWSYYLYHFGNNGLGPQGYSLTLFQGFATAAGYDPVRGPGSSCLGKEASGKCVLPWGSGTKAVSSIVLVANGVSFAIMALVFMVIGPAADYRMFGRWLLLISTAICWAAQFASMSLTSPSRWGAAMALYMVSFISRNIVIAFLAAPFPQLARNTSHSRELRKRHERGELSVEAYEKEKSIEKSRISSVSMICLFIGQVVALSLNLSLLLPLSDNPRVDNYVIVLTTGYWVLFGIWWFIFQQPRPGPKVPKGQSHITIGWKQLFVALKQYKKLPHTFAYLFSIFLLSDGLRTTTTLVSISQNEQFTFSFLQNTYLNLVQGITSAASVVVFWYIQRHWKIDIKIMFLTVCILETLIPVWGMIGIWTDKIGFHNAWEFWVYNVVYGLIIGPRYATSQTMMGELSPPGFEYMFFGLFGLWDRSTAAMIGSNVIQAVVDKNGNIWKGFPVLFVLSALGCLVALFGVNVPKGRYEAAQWAAEQRGTGACTELSDDLDSESSKSEGKNDEKI
ncbi:MFS general substrate transporter [Lactarius psammicola]|nr:MFS general substrate transporter [Lactarius psammicola]